MGSLDVKGAKAQFLLLVDKVNSTHLPGFAIWLDSKLAEYKVQGAIKPDDEATSEQQYPEWISRSLRQNLSFIFQGDKSNTPLGLSSPGGDRPKSVAKRKLLGTSENSSSPKSRRVESKGESSSFSIIREADQQEAQGVVKDIIVKLEDSGEDDYDDFMGGEDTSHIAENPPVDRPAVAETPLPTVEQTFSLQSRNRFPSSAPSTGAFRSDMRYSGSDKASIQQSVSGPVLSGGTSNDESSQGAQFQEASGASSDPGHSSAAEAQQPRKPHTSEDCDVPRKPDRGIWSQKRFKCDLCSKKFSRKSHVEQHMFLHTGQKPYACPYCPEKFRQTGYCYQHQRSAHGIKDVKVIPKTTVTGDEPTKRSTLSEFEIKFRCDQCSKGFGRKAHLAQHLFVHSGQRPYKCKYCGERFTQCFDIYSHQKSDHDMNDDQLISKLTDAEVQEAGKSEPSGKSDASTNSENADEEMRFKCDQCPMKFSRKSHLIQHMFAHTGEMPYKCPHCPKKFKQTSNCYQHQRTAHGIKDITPMSKKTSAD